jgi:hypothetical protein
MVPLMLRVRLVCFFQVKTRRKILIAKPPSRIWNVGQREVARP